MAVCWLIRQEVLGLDQASLLVLASLTVTLAARLRYVALLEASA